MDDRDYSGFRGKQGDRCTPWEQASAYSGHMELLRIMLASLANR